MFTENMPVGTDVLAVRAADQDNPTAPVDYNIVGGDGMPYFAIESTGKSLEIFRLLSRIAPCILL